jgi:hypothetical protein
MLAIPIVTPLNNLAARYNLKGRYSEAEPLFCDPYKFVSSD